ncbi:hypothetical protein ACUXAV_005022 [Cupriavidus metallidurans]|jgi:hypothetical protein|uniref:class I SAM-dependent methyltransferase n=1 Tax=Cupriavidus TaxID=106589 RepID=UPI0004930C16|nr:MULTISPECIES: class I SAM-dependent methyltransferase [Cupriavidus]MCA3184860.1 class I SAM-dependent methyltransferase [Cupriavidus sp.]MCA3192208.1 class I SAM-dependent methyltransferase [Cupriavidus sp.]MCA3233585.1 class I SAM-dependent methyltransferase [Cupriavidus sp.]MDE4922597.1 class I SAM-dependent methyltransferase [Cupriavidus metallidurans]GMG94766.1 hypothetical protein Cmtc_59860 [Cupriavidus sp. TKC]
MNDQDKIRQLGQYPTPAWAAEQLVERYFGDLGRDDLVIEPACGPGAFLGAIPTDVPAIGVEIDPLAAECARVATGREVITGDFCTVDLEARPTAIIGNPPFKLALVDKFLARAHALLPEGGRVGFLLPAYAFQTASRVVDYNQRWTIAQELVPRNVFDGLRLPLVFALFHKERHRRLLGFALFHETVAVQRMQDDYQVVLKQGSGPIWRKVIELALRRLGGEASLADIYEELQRNRPTETRWWKEKIRQTLRRYAEVFVVKGEGRYALSASLNCTGA